MTTLVGVPGYKDTSVSKGMMDVMDGHPELPNPKSPPPLTERWLIFFPDPCKQRGEGKYKGKWSPRAPAWQQKHHEGGTVSRTWLHGAICTLWCSSSSSCCQRYWPELDKTQLIPASKSVPADDQGAHLSLKEEKAAPLLNLTSEPPKSSPAAGLKGGGKGVTSASRGSTRRRSPLQGI